MNLKELQADLQDICDKNGWSRLDTTAVFLLFSEEIGELAKEIRLHTGIKGEKKPKNTANLNAEFADVLNYFMELANRFDIDLTEAYLQKKAVNQLRNWK